MSGVGQERRLLVHPPYVRFAHESRRVSGHRFRSFRANLQTFTRLPRRLRPTNQAALLDLML